VYPQLLSPKKLETVHPEYARLAPLYCKIADLVDGGHVIEARKADYIKKRPGEDQKLYDIRIGRFTYTNALGQAIAAQVGKISSGAVTIDDADDDFWEAFRDGTDRLRKRSERELLEALFREMLMFGGGYVQVEKPASDAAPVSLAQEEALGLTPYICLHSARSVVNWGEADGQLAWIKIRQIEDVTDPFEAPRKIATWTFIDATTIAVYSAEIKLKGDRIVEVKVGEEWKSVDSDEAKVSLKSKPIAHGFPRIPVFRVCVPPDMWAGNSAYLIAIQALDLENSRYDAGIMSYVQRTYKPVSNPDMDLSASFVDNDDPIKSSNAHILKADAFQFNEGAGSTVTTIGEYVTELHDRIRSLFGQQQASATKGAVEQSGASKKMDFVAQEVLLRAFGSLLVDVYQDALRMVAIAAGRPEKPSVSGLDSFDVDSLEAVWAIAMDLGKVREILPPTALKLFAKQLAGLMVKRTSAEQQAEIDEEIETMFAALEPVAVEPPAKEPLPGEEPETLAPKKEPAPGNKDGKN
jgi:hypothetical protein